MTENVLQSHRDCTFSGKESEMQLTTAEQNVPGGKDGLKYITIKASHPEKINILLNITDMVLQSDIYPDISEI